jgi:hypothetical protein
MENKQKNLLKAISDSLEKHKTKGPLSIIPGPIQLDQKTFIIQQKPFFELNSAIFIIGASFIRGAPICIFFNQNNVDVLKPMLHNMVNLIENDIPFVVMGYNSPGFALAGIGPHSKQWGSIDPKLLLERIRPQYEEISKKYPNNVLEMWNLFVRGLIQGKKPIPEDMKPDKDHDIFIL